MTATEQQPPDEGPIRSRAIPLPSRDQVTSVQVQTLLHAAQTLNSLVVSRGATEDSGGATDGGVAAAVDSTIIRICSQLDNIVDDVSRWSMDTQGRLERQLELVYAANLDVLNTQKEAVKQSMSPHLTAGAKLLKIENGQWVAILGNPHNLDECIVGIGDNPADALKNFDEVFRGAKNKLINDNEQSSKVDSGPTETGENPPRGEEDVGGDRGNNGEDGRELPN